jgi:2-keto-4-pentenoate hydratase/2-oxohepta-3-ene-1,7-dioic acid hydratase in catechol pathway
VDISRRKVLKGVVAGASAYPALRLLAGAAEKVRQGETGGKGMAPVRFVRFERRGKRAHGILEGEKVIELEQSPFAGPPARTDMVHPLSEVKLLAPCEPSKVLAMAGNYKSHLGDTPVHKNPEVFIKSPSALLDPEGTIVIPPGTADVHYEGELVVVIGKKAKDVSETEAEACIFGVTCGNDISARDWQQNDVQWWRAKASDTFAPLGPCIARGLDYGNLQLTTRLNGEVKQSCRTSELIFGAPALVSFISRHMTLLPGDLIYTGTSGTTSAMKPGDVVEVEIEKIGTLRNRVG